MEQPSIHPSFWLIKCHVTVDQSQRSGMLDPSQAAVQKQDLSIRSVLEVCLELCFSSSLC